MATNVLFTSVGRRVELLRAFRRAYQALGLDGNTVAIDVDPLAPALRVADRHYLVPPLSSPEYLLALTHILQSEQISVVFPLIDPDIPVLAEHREELESTGARLAVVPPKAARIAADKWLTSDFFRRLGLPAARSWLPGQMAPGDAQFPLFIKPRFGSASQHTFRVNNPRELAFFSDYVPQPIIQEFLEGPEITNDVICDPTGRVLGIVSRERLRVRAGEVLMGKTVFDPDIADACVRIARHLPALGPITVQCILRDKIPVFTEINARLGGGVPLGIAAGADAPRWLLAAVAGIPIEIPPLGSYRHGLYLSRFDDSFFLTEADRDAMAGHRV